MSNWFQDHPASSIVSYTLVIAGATWAASTFILQDNRLNLVRAELESQKASAEQYKAKTELLQKDVEALRAENQEYRNWLAQSKDAVPIMVPRLLELKKQLDALSSQVARTDPSPGVSPPASSPSVTQPPGPPASGSRPPPRLPPTFDLPRSAKLGRASIDEATGIVVAVKKTMPDRTATLWVTNPATDKAVEESVRAGSQIKIPLGNRTIQLTVLEIDFYIDTVGFQLRPLNK